MGIRYFNNKKFGVVFLFLVFFSAACSTSHRAVDSKSTIIPKELYPKPTVQRPKEGALWPGDTRGNYLFGDDKAEKVGDIITVTINENATSTQSATTNTQKDNTMNMSAPDPGAAQNLILPVVPVSTTNPSKPEVLVPALGC